MVVAHAGGPIRRRRMHGGGLAADEVPIIAQEGEIMIRRDVAQSILKAWRIYLLWRLNCRRVSRWRVYSGAALSSRRWQGLL